MKKPRYLTWILGTEAVGILSGILSREGTKRYAECAVKPALTPPGILFPIVWTVLYALMGTARRASAHHRTAGRKDRD